MAYDIRVELPNPRLQGELELRAVRREAELAGHPERPHKAGVQDELIDAFGGKRHHAVRHYLSQGVAGLFYHHGNFFTCAQ